MKQSGRFLGTKVHLLSITGTLLRQHFLVALFRYRLHLLVVMIIFQRFCKECGFGGSCSWDRTVARIDGHFGREGFCNRCRCQDLGLNHSIYFVFCSYVICSCWRQYREILGQQPCWYSGYWVFGVFSWPRLFCHLVEPQTMTLFYWLQNIRDIAIWAFGQQEKNTPCLKTLFVLENPNILWSVL